MSANLFSYLNYDQSKTDEIMDWVNKYSNGKAPSVESINKILEQGKAEYYNENIELLNKADEKNAKYLILDTGVPGYRNGKAAPVCISIVKKGLSWSGGRVGFKNEMLDYYKNLEWSKSSAYLVKENEMAALSAAANGDKEALENYEKIKADRVIKMIIPDKTIEDIRADMLDKSGFWDVEKVKYCINALTRMVRNILLTNHSHITDDGVVLNEDGSKVIFNSGFIGQNLAPICLIGDVVCKDDDIFVNDLAIRPGKAKLDLLGFNISEMEPPMVYREKFVDLRFDFDRFDFDDRDRNMHCISDRKYRISDEADSMSTRELTRKLAESIKLAISMENAYGDFIVPFFYLEENEIQLFVPFYLSDAVRLDKPDAAIIIGEENGYYVPKTILSLKDAYKNAIVLNRCRDNIWLGRKYAD